MPYDDQGRWYLSQEANDVLAKSDRDEKGLIDAFVKSGDLESGEFLRDLWQHGDNEWETTDWESDDELSLRGWAKRYDVLKEYQKHYGTRIPGDIDERNAFGMAMERESRGNDLDFEGNSDLGIMSMMMGGKDYEIDYAHYNSNIAYRSTIAHMRSEFPDMRADFTSVKQIRKAQSILRGEGYVVDEEWTKQNAMPYTNGEIEALEDFRKHNVTRHFDKEYGITTNLNPQDSRSLSVKLYEARKAGNYTRMEEPAKPQWLNIIAGTAPKEEYNSEGERIVTGDDVKQIYQRYWGRDYNSTEKGKGIEQWEVDHWLEQIEKNDWNYDTFEKTIANAKEAKAPGVYDKGKAYFNPNAGKEAEITKKLVAEPSAITPPSLTIRKLKGGVQKPSNLDGFNVKKPVTGGTS